MNFNARLCLIIGLLAAVPTQSFGMRKRAAKYAIWGTLTAATAACAYKIYRHYQHRNRIDPLHRARRQAGDQAAAPAIIYNPPIDINREARNQAYLLEAVQRGDPARVTELLDGGADANAGTEFATRTPRHKPLVVAACSGNAEVIAALIAHGANVNAKSDGSGLLGSTPILSATHPDEPSARVLASAEQLSITPLLSAALFNRANVIELLLAGGAQVDLPNRFGKTPLMLAAERGHIETATALLAHGANPNAHDNRGEQVLVYAIYGTLTADNNAAMVHLLLAHGADINARSPVYQKTVLMEACQNGFIGIVNELLQHEGIDVAGRDSDGHTALEIAQAAQRIPQERREQIIAALTHYMQAHNIQ